MSYESGPIFLFASFICEFFVRVWEVNLIESSLKKSTFTNKGQRDETVCKFKMFKLVMQNFLLIEPMMPFFFFYQVFVNFLLVLRYQLERIHMLERIYIQEEKSE